MSKGNSSDSNRLDEIIAEYLAAVESGDRPSQAELVSMYPEHANLLREFFADKRRIDMLAGVANSQQKTPAGGTASTLPLTPVVESGSVKSGLEVAGMAESLVGQSVGYFWRL